MATREEVEKLKEGWLKDPCWDIETTKGFDEFKEELLAFRKEQDAIWGKKDLDRRVARGKKVGVWAGIYDIDLAQCLSTPDEIENELTRLDGEVGDMGSAEEWAQFVLAREQVRATMFLASQVKRIADLLGEKIDHDASDSDLDFMTKLYKVD